MLILKIDTNGISPEAAVISITLKDTKKKSAKVWKSWLFDSEDKMLSAFVNWFLDNRKDKVLVGYNILKYEIPILLLKTEHHPRFKDFFAALNQANIIDLFAILTFKRKGHIKSLAYYCEEFKVNITPAPAKNIHKLYSERKYAALEAAVKNNIMALEGLFHGVVDEKDK